MSLWICRKNDGMVKVKLFLSKTWKHVGRWEVRLHTFVTSALHGSECPASLSGRFTPRQRAMAPSLYSQGWTYRFEIRDTWFVIVYLDTANLCLRWVDVSWKEARGCKGGVEKRGCVTLDRWRNFTESQVSMFIVQTRFEPCYSGTFLPHRIDCN